MPSPTATLGATYSAYVPDVDDLIALGYTGIRIYWATSEGGSYSLVTTLTLVAAQTDYTYNKTDAAPTDWAYHAYYGATPGEGAASEPVPVGPPQSTRLQVRQGVGRLLGMVEVVTITTATDQDTLVCSELIDPDASSQRFANWFGRLYSGTSKGERRRLRNVANSGYVPASGTLNFGRAFTAAAATDGLELWQPKGDEDPSVLVDEAMQRARTRLWWEETLFVTAEANVSEYYLPTVIVNEGQVKKVEYAGDSYPNRPYWLPVANVGVTFAGGQPLLSLSPDFSAGRVIRVLVNRFADRMDSDTDYWSAPLEWAIAETAREFLESRDNGGKETTKDVDKRLARVMEQCLWFRTTYTPRPSVRLELPR